MTSVGDVGEGVRDVFDGRAAELLELLQKANELTDGMVDTFTATTAGSRNELVGSLGGRLARIQSGLGELAAETATAQQECATLLEEWGIGTVGSRNSKGTYDQTNPHRLSAVHHRGMYKEIGVDLSKVGCIMLDTEPIIVNDVISPEDLYYANDPQKNPYANGIRSEEIPHITLLQGLLKPGPAMREQINRVLEGWSANTVTIQEVTYFAGADPSEPFDCLVAKLEVTDGLLEGHNRLNMLPHITMYPGDYRPHISLAYIKRDPGRRKVYIEVLNERYAGKEIRVRGINYGA